MLGAMELYDIHDIEWHHVISIRDVELQQKEQEPHME